MLEKTIKAEFNDVNIWDDGRFTWLRWIFNFTHSTQDKFAATPPFFEKKKIRKKSRTFDFTVCICGLECRAHLYLTVFALPAEASQGCASSVLFIKLRFQITVRRPEETAGGGDGERKGEDGDTKRPGRRED